MKRLILPVVASTLALTAGCSKQEKSAAIKAETNQQVCEVTIPIQGAVSNIGPRNVKNSPKHRGSDLSEKYKLTINTDGSKTLRCEHGGYKHTWTDVNNNRIPETLEIHSPEPTQILTIENNLGSDDPDVQRTAKMHTQSYQNTIGVVLHTCYNSGAIETPTQ